MEKTDIRARLWRIHGECESLPVWRSICGDLLIALVYGKGDEALKSVLPSVIERLEGIYAYYVKHLDEFDDLMKCRIQHIKRVAEELREIAKELYCR